MKPTLCLTLISVLIGTPVTTLRAQQTQAPGTLGGVVVQASGVISGSVASSSGRRLSDITMQLLNPTGVVVGTTVTTRNGEFKFQPVNYDTYTLQCVDKKNNNVIGTSSVMLTAPTQSVSMTCTSDVAGYWKKWGLLTGLGAAALAAGATALVATGGDASGSR
jgi:hypothetical protein